MVVSCSSCLRVKTSLSRNNYNNIYSLNYKIWWCLECPIDTITRYTYWVLEWS